MLDALGIDYCCGGQQALRDACETGSLDLIDVVSRIKRHDEAADEPRPDWVDADLVGMIGHIEEASFPGKSATPSSSRRAIRDRGVGPIRLSAGER